MRLNRVSAAVAAMAISLIPALPANAADDAYGKVLSILPPGQSGSINSTELLPILLTDLSGRIAVDGKTAPQNFADQLEMYDAFNKLTPDEIRNADLTKYYKDAGFEPDKVVRQATPKPGVTIRWDSYGVPYIKGDTRADVAWGAGYAGTLDRMFLQDVLRHAGAGKAAEFVGGTESNIAMDREQLRSAPYTEQEAADQVAAVAGRYGAEGTKLLAEADAYLAGINAAQEKMCPLGSAGADCPAEYAVLGKLPAKWTRADLTYVASLVGGIFGKGGGGEYANAIWFQRLKQRFGDAEARKVYDDLRAKNDPEAPTTSSVRMPYGGSEGINPDLPGVAMPDLNGPVAGGSGSDVEGNGLPDLADLTGNGEVGALSGRLDTPFGTLDLRATAGSMSNAAVVSGSRTRSGKPVAVFGPQTSYYTPQLLTEQVLEGPGVKARGVAFAGTNLVVQIGRGLDYAWSPTSANSDIVDTIVEPLCNTDGSAATVNSTAYLNDGVCTPMISRTHTETVLPNLGSSAGPETLKMRVLRTERGIVQLRTTSGGKPVAIVQQRSTYGHEVDSIVGFSRLGNPNVVKDAASFQHAAEAIDYTFNWHYLDSKDIAYFGSGLLPKRADGVEYDLPRRSDAKYDWQGSLAFESHARQINPPSGQLVSWNNKQAPGFSAADDVWGYGSVYRSLAISDRLSKAGGDITPESLASILQDAATVDSRAFYTLPMLLQVIGDDPESAKAVSLLKAWLADGAHRVDRDRDGAYDHQAAIAIFDAWWENAAKASLRGGIGSLVDTLPEHMDDHPRQGIGSAWNDVAWYGYVSKGLRQLLGQPVQGRWHRSYCGDGSLDQCRTDLRASLDAAIAGLLKTQGKSSADQLTYDKHIDDIKPTNAGVVAVRPIDWQNRPTFQQVATFSSHR